MRLRQAFGLPLSILLLLLAAGSGLAREPEPGAGLRTAGPAGGASAPWFIETVDASGDVGQYVSVAINSDRTHFRTGPYFSYYDATNEDLRWAFHVGDGQSSCGDDMAWACGPVAWTGDVGKYTSNALDPAGEGSTGIAYHDASDGALKYLRQRHLPPWWESYTIDEGIPTVSSTGLFTSLGYDAEGKPHIAYQFVNPGNVDALMVAYPADGDGNCGIGEAAGLWQCDTIQTGVGVGQHASLAVDGDGHLHIAYFDAGNGDLWYATSRFAANCGPGDSWSCYAVDSTADVVGEHASLYVDSDNHFHIAYYDDTNDVLKYAEFVGSDGNCALDQARCDVIEPMMQGYNEVGLAMAEDPSGYPVIAYQSEYGSLNVARPMAAVGMPGETGNCGPETPFATWYCETIDHYGWVTPYRSGDYVSIAVNSSGLITIGYQGFIRAEGGVLKVAYQLGQTFLPQVMASQ